MRFKVRFLAATSALLTASCSFLMWFFAPAWLCFMLLLPLGLSYFACSILMGDTDSGE